MKRQGAFASHETVSMKILQQKQQLSIHIMEIFTDFLTVSSRPNNML